MSTPLKDHISSQRKSPERDDLCSTPGCKCSAAPGCSTPDRKPLCNDCALDALGDAIEAAGGHGGIGTNGPGGVMLDEDDLV